METKTISLNVEDLFTPKKQELEDLAKKHESLRKDKVTNKDELKVVHDAEQELVKTRTWITKLRKEYTAPLEQAKKDAIAKEKELLWVISPVEEDLKERKKEFLDEEERVKKEKLEEKRKFLQDRVDQLWLVGYSSTDLHALSQMSAEWFKELLDDQTKKFEEREKELEAEKTIKFKNEIRTWILKCNSQSDLNEMLSNIERCWFIHDDFKEEYDAKKSMIDQQDKMNADQKKIDDENQKIADEKKKIQDEKDEEQRKKDLEKEKDKARKEWEKKAKEDAAAKKLADAQKAKDQQAKLDKQKKYQEFLEKNWITQEQIDSGEITREVDQVAKTATFYKKIWVFSL